MRLSFTKFVEQMVHVLVYFHSDVSFAFSRIYAKCTRVGRRCLWQGMEFLSNRLSLPWLVVGDFNVISSFDERVGGSPANVTNIEEFNSAMLNCGLSSADFDGHLFTWTNGTVWQRLDRVLINAQWMDAYPVTRVSHLARGRSGHASLLIKCGLGCS